MSSNQNKKVRLEMIKKYGNVDMFDEARVEEKIDEYNLRHKHQIKTYREFLEEKDYKRKFIKKYDNQMTVHHLEHCSIGGETTEENCVITSSLKQFYIHSLPREDEEIINNIFRSYKGLPLSKSINEKRKTYKEVKVVVGDVELNIEIKSLIATPDELFYQPTLEEYIEEVKEDELYQEHKKARNERVKKKFEEER